MGPLRSLWENLRSLNRSESSSGLSEGEHASTFTDVIFDSKNKEEARLAQIWSQYQHACSQDQRGADKVLQQFLREFERVYDEWTPDEAVFSDPGARFKGSAGLPGSAAPQAGFVVRGCRGGHPKEVLAALVGAAHQLTQNSGTDDGVASWGFWVLEGLEIAFRSSHNCGLLVDLGALQALCRLLKVVVSRLNSLAARFKSGDASAASSLSSLQLQLAQVAGTLSTCVRVSLRVPGGSPPIMQQYVREEALYCSVLPREPATRAEAEAMSRGAQPLVECGVVVPLMEILGLLSMLRRAGGPMAAKSEELVLECLLCLTSASSAAAAQLYDRDPTQCMLKDLVGMLGDGCEAIDGHQTEASSPQNAAAKQLRRQALILQMIGGVVKRDSRNLDVFEEAQGNENLTKVLLWVEGNFPAAATGNVPPVWPASPTWSEAAERSSAQASTSGRDPEPALKQAAFKPRGPRRKSVRFNPSQLTSGPGANPAAGGGEGSRRLVEEAMAPAAVPESRALTELFWVLESWLSLKQRRQVGADWQHWERLLRGLLRALFGCFQDQKPRGVVGGEAGGRLALQHCCLDFLRHVLDSVPASLTVLRTCGYLDLLFGPAMFFCDQPSRNPLGKQPSPVQVLAQSFQSGAMAGGSFQGAHTSERRVGEVRLELRLQDGGLPIQVELNAAEGGSQGVGDTGHLGSVLGSPVRQKGLDGGAVRTLRLRVLRVVEHAACLASAQSNLLECRQVLEALEACCLQGEAVLVLAPCLSRVLKARRDATLESLDSLSALLILGRSIKTQQDAQVASQAVLKGAGMAGSEGETAIARAVQMEARFSVVRLLGSLLQASPGFQVRAISCWEVVNAVFGLLHDDDAMRHDALRMVIGLMRARPATEDDALAKVVLFTKYVEVLPATLHTWEARGLQAVFDLLAGIQEVVAVNQAHHQNLFRKAECFVQIANLLNLDCPPDLGCQLSCQVLATLTSLMAGNEASRCRVREDVGYQVLHCVITGLLGEEGPSLQLLMRLLALVLEREYREGLAGQKIANHHAVGMMFSFMAAAQPEDQFALLHIWQGLVAGNMANLAACERAELNSVLIAWLAASMERPDLQAEIAALLQLTAAYSIIGRDLRALFALLKLEDGGKAPVHTRLLLRSLAIMAHHQGPAAFFDFADETAGLMRTTPIKLPGSKGYTFSTWLRLEKIVFDPSTAGQSLFCFLSGGGQGPKGVAAALQGEKLLVYSAAGGKPLDATMKFPFQAKRWYHLAITHTTGGPLSPAIVSLYVDGVLEYSTRLKYPKVSEPLEECSIGAKLSDQECGLGLPLSSLSGQLGCIYLFEAPLSEGQVQALWQLGPDYQSTFQGTESDPAFEQAAEATALVLQGRDALAPLLLMSYNAQAAAGRMLFDTTCMDRNGGEEGGSASILEGTQLCCTCQLRDILHCLGGVSILLPLLTQLDAPQDGPEASPSAAVDVVNLFTAVLTDSPTNRQHMVQVSGAALMGQLLQRSSPEHLSIDLVEALKGLATAVEASPDLHTQVLRHLLLDLSLFRRADPATQRHLLRYYFYLSKEAPALFCKLFGVPQLLDDVRRYYWTTPSQESVRPSAGGGSLPPAVLRDLRKGLLDVAGALLRHTVHPADHQPHRVWASIQAFVSFVGECPDAAMLEDVLTALEAALRHGSFTHKPLVACLREHGGERLFTSLLQREQQSLRLIGLQILTAFQGPQPAPGSPGSQGLDIMKASGFWTSVNDQLLMFPLNPPVRAVLLEMLCVGTQPHQAGTTFVPVISCGQVVGILLRLLLGCGDARERLDTLEALHHLIVEGPRHNRQSVVEQANWQSWFLELLLDSSPLISKQQRPHSRSGSATDGETGARSSSHTRSTSNSGGDLLKRRGGSPGGRGTEDRSSADAGLELRLVRGMLRALLTHCMLCLEAGWSSLQRIAFTLKEQAERGSVDGWGVMHMLTADLVRAILDGTGESPAETLAAADAWTKVSVLAAEPTRSNALGLLGLIDQLASGSLMPVTSGSDGAPTPLNPTAEAVAWAQLPDSHDIPNHVWTGIGLAEAEAGRLLTAEAWQLYDLAWQLMYVMHKAAEGLASLRAPALPSAATRQTQSAAVAGIALGAMPFGLEKHLASIPVLGRLEESGQDPKVTEPADNLGEQSGRLMLRLLVKYLQSAAPKPAEAASNNAIHLLHYVVHPDRQTSRAYIHLLMAGLVAVLARMDALGAPNSGRVQLVRRTMLQVVQAAADVFAVEGMAPPQLPPLDDPQFQSVAEGTLLTGHAAAAVRKEVVAMASAAEQLSRILSELAAEEASATSRQRQLRQNLQEDARQALGLMYAAEKARRHAARTVAEEEAHSLNRHWRSVLRSLQGGVGVWGDPTGASKLHWKLDKFEDPSRRRLRMKRNYKPKKYQQPSKGAPVVEEGNLQDPIALPGVKRRTGSQDLDEEGGSNPSSPQGPSPQKGAAREEEDDERDSMSADDLQQVLLSTSCHLVSARQVLAGNLSLTASQMLFCGEEAPSTPTKSKGGGKKYKRWRVASLVEVHHARFLLRPFALEFFLRDQANALLSFPSAQVARDVAKQLQRVNTSLTIFDRKRKQDVANRLQQQWQRWEISNFDYIMQLNLLAGRTYNDLNQYPVYPWVITDYTSERLDLSDPASYRDLSRPVGALDQKRLAFFRERYESLQDPDSEIPPFHYGSHYSSAAIVLYYLIRMEPFTDLNRRLQGDRFDHADRLFHSMAETWQNSLHNSTDVKELTPEFFYQPEFLLNPNGFDLGERQDGTPLGDVELPPWAGGSPDEFVRIQREALEGEHVSSRLHLWLDLVFGVAQQGKAAQEADNVFYYLTYEGAVDLDDIEDPMQRKAVEDQISSFGQTPSQLFRRRHGKRGPPPPPSLQPLLNGPDAMKLAVVGKPPTRRPNIAVAELAATGGRVVLINADRAVSCHRWLSPRDQASFTFSGAVEAAYNVEADPSPPRLLGTPFAADLDCTKCYSVLPGGHVIVSCGYWDNSIRCYGVDDGHLLQSLRHHKDIVTCIALGADGRTLVSGSRDTTVIIWDALNPQRAARKRGAPPLLPLHAHPRHVLFGHSDTVTCLALCPHLDLCLSASAEGSMLFHLLSTGRHVRSMRLPGGAGPPSLLAFAPHQGLVVAHSQADLSLHSITINGRHRLAWECTERLSALVVSPDGRFVLTGGAKGVITLMWLHSFQAVIKYETGKGPITAMAVTEEECILAGTLDGSLLVIAPDPRRSISRRISLAHPQPSAREAVAIIKFER